MQEIDKNETPDFHDLNVSPVMPQVLKDAKEMVTERPPTPISDALNLATGGGEEHQWTKLPKNGCCVIHSDSSSRNNQI